MAAIARVVVRSTGDYHVGYYARPETMEGAIILGTVHIGAVHRHQHRMRDWIDLMRHIAWELTIDAQGDSVRWNDILIDEEG